MSAGGLSPDRQGILHSRLAYHLRRLREDATDPAIPTLERLVLVRERVARIREIRRELNGTAEAPKRITPRQP